MKGAAALCLLALLAAATISDAALTQHDGAYAPPDFFNVRQWFSCFLHGPPLYPPSKSRNFRLS